MNKGFFRSAELGSDLIFCVQAYKFGEIGQAEKDYEEKKKKLSAKKREEVKQLVAENSEDPSNLSKLLAERFGISHIGEE